ncbi:hypothetical protein DVH05_021133 [Phytophthora capsici]|nr:hypothetical protein DVH05_021133 [Phytophthora capsici]
MALGERRTESQTFLSSREQAVPGYAQCALSPSALEQNYQTEEAVEGEDEWVAASSYATEGGNATAVTDLSDEMGEISLSDEDKPKASTATKGGSSTGFPYHRLTDREREVPGLYQ